MVKKPQENGITQHSLISKHTDLLKSINAKSLTHKVDLIVVPLAEYQRDMQFSQLLSHLSPNIKTLAAAHGYSFLGLVGEVGPFHVGIGTSEAFQVIMLPQSLKVSVGAWRLLQRSLSEFGIHSQPHVSYRKGKKKWYEGLRLSIDNVNDVSSFKAFMTVLAWTKKYNIPVSFMPTFDKSIGTPAVRQWYQSNKSFDAFMQSTKQKTQNFLDLNKDILLYGNQPKVVRSADFFDYMCV